MATIRLPYPPSTNAIWRHVVIGRHARVLLSREGRAYRERVAKAVSSQCPWIREPYRGRVRVVVTATMPDRRARDVENVLKAAMDGLTHAGVWADDSQIDDLRVVRGPVKRPGGLLVTIWPMGEGVAHG